MACVRSPAIAIRAHHGMVSFVCIRWVTGDVPPAAFLVRRLSAKETLQQQRRRERAQQDGLMDKYINERMDSKGKGTDTQAKQWTAGGGRRKSGRRERGKEVPIKHDRECLTYYLKSSNKRAPFIRKEKKIAHPPIFHHA